VPLNYQCGFRSDSDPVELSFAYKSTKADVSWEFTALLLEKAREGSGDERSGGEYPSKSTLLGDVGRGDEFFVGIMTERRKVRGMRRTLKRLLRGTLSENIFNYILNHTSTWIVK